MCAVILAPYTAAMITSGRWRPFLDGARVKTRNLMIWVPLFILSGTIINSFVLPLGVAFACGSLAVGGALGLLVARFIWRQVKEK